MKPSTKAVKRADKKVVKTNNFNLRKTIYK